MRKTPTSRQADSSGCVAHAHASECVAIGPNGRRPEIGCSLNSYLVWDARNARKIQSGFHSAQAAHAYIAKRQKHGRWIVALFTPEGIAPLPKPRLPRATELSPRPCAYCGGLFGPQRSSQRFCCAQCRITDNNFRVGKRTPITDEMREQIKARLTGTRGEQKQLAQEFGISAATVSRIWAKS